MFVELVECKKDRARLTLKTDEMQVAFNSKTDILKDKLIDLSSEIGRMRGHFDYIDKRMDNQSNTNA
jgi:hypothetical protein